MHSNETSLLGDRIHSVGKGERKQYHLPRILSLANKTCLSHPHETFVSHLSILLSCSHIDYFFLANCAEKVMFSRQNVRIVNTAKLTRIYIKQFNELASYWFHD